MPYTLVRHNCWTIPYFPLFARGLQPYFVGPRTAEVVRGLGGLVFDSEEEAWGEAERLMYPAGSTGRPPNPAGHFMSLSFLELPLFIPESSVIPLRTGVGADAAPCG